MGFATSSCIEYGACFKQAAAEAAFFLQIVKKLLQCPPADLTQGRFTLTYETTSCCHGSRYFSPLNFATMVT